MSDERDIDAAEYVLGTLPADERARFVERLAADASLRAEVRAWQTRLAPLDQSAAAETPPAHVWQAIARVTGDAAPASAAQDTTSNVIQLKRKLAAWRGAALITGALAAGLAAFAIIDRASIEEPAGGRYVAVVDTGGHEPALIAEVDTTTGVIRIKSLAAQAPAGSSLELWHVAENHAPRSLGLLEADLDLQTIQGSPEAGPLAGLIAVSVEPEGGSPTGQPTGEVIYTGELVPME